MNKLKQLLKLLIPINLVVFLRNLHNNYFDGFSIKSYSQEGEDMILSRLFANKAVGFYVDIGAHHPFRFSNTYYFYKKGWQGINIDAMPKSMELFDKFRPRDINLEVPINEVEQDLTFFSFNEPALNSFSKDLSYERNGKNGYYIQDEFLLKTKRLSAVLEEYLPKGRAIDFLTIDVEGFDLNILRSNDWMKYRPKCILIEILGNSLHEIEGNEIFLYLNLQGYVLFAKSVNTVFFIENEM